MNWIDIKASKPKHGEHVIFWVKFKDSKWHAKTGWFKSKHGANKIIIASPHCKDGALVTHWMPLPEATQ